MSRYTQCFDKVAFKFMELGTLPEHTDIKVVHAIIEARKPGSSGTTGHAWIERNQSAGRTAIDPTTLVTMPRDAFREGLQAKNIIEYTPAEFLFNWWRNGFPGPWDEEIKKVTAP